jgi:CrcB protein
VDEMVLNLGCIFLGGGLGACLRYVIHLLILSKSGTRFPISTLLINLLGAFLIGWWMTRYVSSFQATPRWQLFLVTGILGGFTTFSALMWDFQQLISQGFWNQAVLYLAGSLVGGVAAVLFGMWVGR